MATINYSLSTKKDKQTNQCEILIRFFHGRINQRSKTNIFVKPEFWCDSKQQIIIPKPRLMTDEQKSLIETLSEKANRLSEISNLVQQSFIDLGGGKMPIAKDWLKSLLILYNFPNQSQASDQPQRSIFDDFELFIETQRFSQHRKSQYFSVWRTFKRFELFRGLHLTLDNLTDNLLRQFEKFLTDEHQLITKRNYKAILHAVPESRTPKPRGKNSINDSLKKIRTFILWANNQGKTTNNPFRKFKISECVYGTPYYITIDERNKLYNADFSDDPSLERQRDIFVFQCLVGCRVSDLWAMTKHNLINGAIEYIPRKTKEGRPVTVRVPLNAIAREIIEKYKDLPGDQLFEFTSQQKYNIAIKKMFRRAEITRVVTVINPTTREEEQHPICDLASSHLARRCFIGNLYKKVKDPNLIGKLSGHKEGSRAFNRYREIDEETSKELVTMLE